MMYKVIIEYNQHYITIDDMVGGKITQAINSIDSFNFTVYPNSKGYDSLFPFVTKVKVVDETTDKDLFVGRVLKIEDSMDENGLILKDVTCESRMAWLCDSVLTPKTYPATENGARTIIEGIVNQHNSCVGYDKKLTCGQVTVSLQSSPNSFITNYENTLDWINDTLIERLGGEIQIRDGDDGTVYLDYLDRIGEPSNTRIELAINMKTITQDIDETSIITRLYPLGANKDNGTTRVNISSVNDGKSYIDADDSLIAKYGIIAGTHTWDDVTMPSNLLKKAKEWLKTANKAKEQYEITALDLSKINKRFDEFELGNTYRIVNPLMNIDEELRIIGITTYLDSPYNSRLTFGDRFETMTGFVSKKTKTFENKIQNEKVQTNSYIESKIANATALITGAKGGYVILDPSEKPSRILIMDTNDIDTCTSCIQLNKNGIGFWNKFKNGGSAKQGPYNNAWTIDGNLVASYITANVLTGLAINNGSGTFKVDKNGNVNAKSMTITNGTINNGSGTFKVDSSGNVTANSFKSSSAEITGGSVNISTSSKEQSAIKLSNNQWAVEISPLEIRLKNTSENFFILIQAGGIFGYQISGSSEILRFLIDPKDAIIYTYNSSGKITTQIEGNTGDIFCNSLKTKSHFFD